MTLDKVVDVFPEKDKKGAGDEVVKEELDVSIEPPLPYREPPVSQQEHATSEYLEQLMWDKNELRTSPLPLRHVSRLIESEIKRVVSELSSTYVQSAREKEEEGKEKMTLQEKIAVPVDKYPRYNFVGRILGPRGMTAKQLEEETGCKIMVRGRGTGRTEPLHVLILCEDYPDKVEAKMQKAIEKINELLSPPPEGKDELKRKQLIELSIINGTYRPTTATKLALQAPRLSNASFGTSSNYSSLDHNSFLGDPMKRKLMTPLLPCLSQSSDPLSSHSPPHSPRHYVPNVLDDNQALLASFLATQNSSSLCANPLVNDYYRQLMAISLSDPSLLSSLYSSPSHDFPHHLSIPSSLPSSPPSSHVFAPPPSPSLIPQANLQQYLDAASMLSRLPSFSSTNNAKQSTRLNPSLHDGSGDMESVSCPTPSKSSTKRP